MQVFILQATKCVKIKALRGTTLILLCDIILSRYWMVLMLFMKKTALHRMKKDMPTKAMRESPPTIVGFCIDAYNI